MATNPKAWCHMCARMVTIDHEDTATAMTAHGDVEIPVTRLICSHTVSGPETIAAPAPGQPYAGPGVAVAATTHPRDLRSARDRQRQMDADPWADAFPQDR